MLAERAEKQPVARACMLCLIVKAGPTAHGLAVAHTIPDAPLATFRSAWMPRSTLPRSSAHQQQTAWPWCAPAWLWHGAGRRTTWLSEKRSRRRATLRAGSSARRCCLRRLTILQRCGRGLACIKGGRYARISFCVRAAASMPTVSWCSMLRCMAWPTMATFWCTVPAAPALAQVCAELEGMLSAVDDFRQFLGLELKAVTGNASVIEEVSIMVTVSCMSC